MATQDGPDRRRQRRPRFYEDYSTTDDDETRPRRGKASGGSGNGNGNNGDDRRPARAERQARPPAAPMRRPSILVDPAETSSQRAKRRPSANANVRLRTSSDEGDDDGGRPRQRGGGGGGGGITSAQRRRHDLERKTSHEDKRFRDRRDEYESDEGETLRKYLAKSKRGPGDGPARQRFDGDDDDDRSTIRPVRKGKDRNPPGGPNATIPLRGKPRASSESRQPPPRGVAFEDDGPGPRPRPRGAPSPAAIGAGVAGLAGAGVAGAAVGSALASRRRRDYDTDPESPIQRRQSYRDPQRERNNNRRGYYGEEPDSPRDYRPRRTYDDDDDDGRGYRSDHGRRPRLDDDDYERGPYGQPRQGGARGRGGGRGGRYDQQGLRPPPKNEEYYSDYRDEAPYRRGGGDRQRRDRYDEDPRDKYYDDRRDVRGNRRPRYEEEFYDDRANRRKSGIVGGSGRGGAKWQKEAGALFMTYAFPVIRKEGTKFVRKEAQKYLQKRNTQL